MKLLLLADGLVGRSIAKYIYDAFPNDIALIVTTNANDIYQDAVRKKIPVSIYESEQKIIDNLNFLPDIGVLAWWPKIIKEPLLRKPIKGFINTHPSYLPYNRGKNYNFWSIVEEVPFGVTIHKVEKGIDNGDILFQEKIEYDWEDTGETLYHKAQSAITKLFCKHYHEIRKGSIKLNPQPKGLGSFHTSSELSSASKILLNKNYIARDLLNLLRAKTFEGYPGCWFEDSGDRYEITVKISKVNR